MNDTRALVRRLRAENAALTAERDAYRKAKQENDERFQIKAFEACATIGRVRALAAQWEQVGPSYQSLPEGAAQLRQVLDEVPL